MNLTLLFAIVFVAAAIAGVGMKKLKLPALLGYLLAGVILSASGLVGGPQSHEVLELMGNIGVMLLLFLVGLEFPIQELRSLGWRLLSGALVQVVLSGLAGFIVIRLLGMQTGPALFIGAAMAFSSTIMVVKLLSEKGELTALHGRVVLSFLLIQDFVAMALLALLPSVARGGDAGIIVLVVLKALLLCAAAILAARFVAPRLLTVLHASPEVLYVGSIGWCMLVAAIVSQRFIGFGPEIGGFLAGLSLAGGAEHLQIAARTRPLRDFFLTVFFVWLGSSITLTALSQSWLPALALSLLVAIINPLIVMTILGVMGYTKRTIFLAGLALGQLSEFSLVLVAQTQLVYGLSQPLLSVVALTTMATMVVSSWLYTRSETMYPRFRRMMSGFELLRLTRAAPKTERKDRQAHILLFGHHRTGSRLLPQLMKFNVPVTVVDFNPSRVDELAMKGVDTVYGDLGDVDIYEEVGLTKARMVISTIADEDDNARLLLALSQVEPKPVIVLTANDKESAARLYGQGATYVLVPHLVGGDLLAHIVRTHAFEAQEWKELQKL